ncbi:DUF4175 family protein, partial [Ameyamaea chiangmaiensis]
QNEEPPTDLAPPPSPPADPQEQARADGQRTQDRASQRALARALDELQQEFKGLMGKEPAGLKDAHAAMRDARKALADGNDQAASVAQQKALKALQDGGQQMRQTMQQASRGTPSFLPGFGSQGQGSGGNEPSPGGEDDGDDKAQANRDPLGRESGEGKNGLDSDTHVPDTISREQARDIEQELRRRDSDRTRPQEELDYLDRLLKPF